MKLCFRVNTLLSFSITVLYKLFSLNCKYCSIIQGVDLAGVGLCASAAASIVVLPAAARRILGPLWPPQAVVVAVNIFIAG